MTQMWLVLSVVTDETSPNTFPAGSCGNDGSNSKRGSDDAPRTAIGITTTINAEIAEIAERICFFMFLLIKLGSFFQLRVRRRVVFDPHLRLRLLQEDVDVG